MKRGDRGAKHHARWTVNDGIESKSELKVARWEKEECAQKAQHRARAVSLCCNLQTWKAIFVENSAVQPKKGLESRVDCARFNLH